VVRHGVEQGPSLRRTAPLVGVGLAAGWTVAALLAGGFFTSTRALLALAAASGLCLLAAHRGLARPSLGVLALGSLALWTGLSAFWGGSPSAALLPLLYAAVLWLAEQGDRRTSFVGLRIAILVVAVTALAARAFGLAPAAGSSSHRLQWPVTYTNGLGVVAATGVLLWLGVPSRRPWFARAAAAVCAVVVVLTFSRSAAFGCALGAAVLVVATGRVPRRALLAAGAAAAVAAVLAGPALLSSFASSSPDSRDAGRLVDLSGNGRTRIWHEAWHEAVSSPVGGIGAARFHTSTGGSSAHSLELQTFVDLGLVGLLALGVFLFAGLRGVRGSPVAAGVFTLWLVVASIDWIWELPASTIPVLIAVGGASRRHG
jgi:O-antigen ligase